MLSTALLHSFSLLFLFLHLECCTQRMAHQRYTTHYYYYHMTSVWPFFFLQQQKANIWNYIFFSLLRYVCRLLQIRNFEICLFVWWHLSSLLLFSSLSCICHAKCHSTIFLWLEIQFCSRLEKYSLSIFNFIFAFAEFISQFAKATCVPFVFFWILW